MKIKCHNIPFPLFGILFLSFLFLQCDKIKPPYIKETNEIETTVTFPPVSSDTLFRKILLEEYSAQQCQNCPTQGHVPLAQLLEQYGKKVVAVCIHAGTLARPDLIPPFDYDFRTDIGTQLYNEYVIGEGSGIPCAVINRTRYNGNYPLLHTEWNNAIQNIDTQLIAGIQIINEFDNNVLKTHIKSTFYNSYTNKVVLSVFLIENGIISPQLSGSEIIEDYVHNHVFRSSINDLAGSYLAEEGYVEKDSSYTQSYQLSFADKDWEKYNCYVVAFLFDEVTKEILQVEIAVL